jgi:hypothetical protein
MKVEERKLQLRRSTHTPAYSKNLLRLKSLITSAYLVLGTTFYDKCLVVISAFLACLEIIIIRFNVRLAVRSSPSYAHGRDKESGKDQDDGKQEQELDRRLLYFQVTLVFSLRR